MSYSAATTPTSRTVTRKHCAVSRRSLPPKCRCQRRRAALLPVSDEKIGRDYKIRRMLEGSLLEPIDAHFYWNGTFDEAQRSALLAHPDGHPSAIPLPGKTDGYLNRFLWLDQLCYLPDDILNKCDRMSMAHSLEVRPPFLDHRIIEFAATLPENFKIRGNSLKFILRDLMQDKLPQSVLTRKKEGFDIPAHHWLRTTLKPLAHRGLSQRKQRPPIRNFPLGRCQRRVAVPSRVGAPTSVYHLWGLLILFLWMRRWKIQPPSPIESLAYAHHD